MTRRLGDAVKKSHLIESPLPMRCLRHFISVSPSRRLFVSAWFILLTICVFLSSCSEQLKEPKRSGPARIAVVVPRTGPLQDEGEMLRLGALLAIQEKGGRVADLEVEMVTYHSPCDARGAIAPAERIAAETKVSAVIGYLCAEAICAVFPIYQNAHLALVNPTVSADYIRKDETRHLFPLLYGDGEQGAFLAAYAKKGLGLNRVGILSDRSTFGNLLRASFLTEANSLGMELVADISIDPKPLEAARAVQLFESANPEGIFLAASPNAASLFLLERQQQHLDGVVLGSDQLADLDFYEMTGQAVEGLLLCQPILLGQEDHQKGKFIRMFEQANKRKPNWIAAAGYDAMRLVLEVLASSGPERIAILRALREISGPEAAFSGLGGPIFFKGDGSSQKPFFVAAVHNGRLTPARPPTVSFPDSPAKVK